MSAGAPPCPCCRGSRYVFSPHPPPSIWSINQVRCPVCHGEGTTEPEPVADDFPDELPTGNVIGSCEDVCGTVRIEGVHGEIGRNRSISFRILAPIQDVSVGGPCR